MEYVFDTNTFNKILDDHKNICKKLDDKKIYASHIQLREIEATQNTNRREKLLAVFHEIDTQILKTESTAGKY